MEPLSNRSIGVDMHNKVDAQWCCHGNHLGAHQVLAFVDIPLLHFDKIASSPHSYCLQALFNFSSKKFLELICTVVSSNSVSHHQIMEDLLSTSFDLLSSYDPVHIRKGLRCLEGFLAKMCLQSPSTPSKSGARAASAANSSVVGVASRPKDAAFKEFLRLQSGFEWNGRSTSRVAKLG